jgi:hypothetical protein
MAPALLALALAAAPLPATTGPAPRIAVAVATARAEIITLEPVRPDPARADRLQRQVDPTTHLIEFY